MRQPASQPIRRAGALVYKYHQGVLKYLLVTSALDPGLYIFPQGKVELGETAEEAARRETLEESGCDVEIGKWIGSFSHSHGNEDYFTDIFLANIIKQGISGEGRDINWFTYDQTLKLDILGETRAFLEETNKVLLDSGPPEKGSFGS